MLNNDFLKTNCFQLLHYLNQSSNLMVVLLDHDLKILDCSSSFIQILEEKTKPLDELFINYLAPEDHNLQLPVAEHGYRKLRFTIVNKFENHNNMIGYIYSVEEGFLIFCELTWMSEDKIIYEISKLNNEMANMTRELNKKNIALEKANTKINSLLRTDNLTGIANRLHFQEYYQKVYSLATRHKLPLSLVMADLDYFKAVNDRYGHQAGDGVLIEFARLLKDNCRDEDLPARYGGEEFIILLIQATLDEAVKKADHIRQELERLTIGPEKIKLTASFGVAGLTAACSMEDLVEKADQALYEAKRGGRNRVNSLA